MTRHADYAVTLTTIICALIAGCATGEIRHSVQDGEAVVEHIDTTDQPPTCGRSVGHGCFQIRVSNGRVEKHIWKSSVAPSYVARHEAAHKGDSKTPGMRHTAWVRHPMYNLALTSYQQSQARNVVLCATITAAAHGYPIGHLLCNDGKKEWTIPPATAFAKE